MKCGIDIDKGLKKYLILVIEYYFIKSQLWILKLYIIKVNVLNHAGEKIVNIKYKMAPRIPSE